MKRKSLGRKAIAFLIVILLIFAVGLGVGLAVAANGSANFVVSPEGAFVKGASVIFYKSGSTVYAINGSTGVELTSGADPSTVIETGIANGGLGYLTRGSYTLQSNLDWVANATLVGEGIGSTIINLNGYNITLGASMNNIGFSNFKLSGTGVEAAITVSGANLANLLFSHIWIHNVNYGFYMPSDSLIYDSLLEELIFTNCTVAIDMRGDQITLVRPHFRLNEKAIKFEGTSELNPIIIGGVFSGNDYDLDVENLALFLASFRGCWFEREGEYSLGLGNGNLFYAGTRSSSGTRQYVFESCKFSEYTKINMSWIDSGSKFRIRFRDSHFHNQANLTFISSGYPYFENCYRIDGGVHYAIRTQNTVALSSISNGSYVAHGLVDSPDYVSITLSVQGYAWYGTLNSTHVRVYASRASGISGTLHAEYAP